MTLEQIQWRGTHVELPNTARSVLIYGPELAVANAGERHDDPLRVGATWLGWYEPAEREWYSVDAVALGGRVVAWAEMPTGAA